MTQADIRPRLLDPYIIMIMISTPYNRFEIKPIWQNVIKLGKLLRHFH